ncbi:Clavaminate synthase-like protein [Microthyrium microscopicum]|uniref:Clavaminate synthase-like protein n=1 Tax=Microthyrium microscopicum TaxID=703497 RepID=A0A6A6US27_9PEZI|nr:Clavaminate synthase-like protein [Microthyrium microscopicum]
MATLRLTIRSQATVKSIGRIAVSHLRNPASRSFSHASQRQSAATAESTAPRVQHAGPLYSQTTQPINYSSTIKIPIDGEAVEFDSIFLRDACVCPECVDVSSTNKNFATSDIPSDIEGSFRGISTTNGQESAIVHWNRDAQGWSSEHVTTIPIDTLQRLAAGDKRTHISHFKPSNRVFWDSKTMEANNNFIDFAEYKNTDKAVYQALKMLESHGLVFLRNVPDSTSTDSGASITDVVSRIGPLRSTFYGLTWDVRSVPKAINVAYTNKFLGLHTDLCYLDLTPQYQILHSMRAKAPGGESMFADSFKAAETLRQTHPKLFEALVRFPVTFHYYNAGQSYRQIRCTVELEDKNDLNSPIKNTNWSPPFQGPFALDIGSRDGGKALREFHEASQKFEDLISAPENVFELRMNEGECVLFDNRRVLHARREFDPTKGERWLKGAYLDRDVFASRLARLEEQYGT